MKLKENLVFDIGLHKGEDTTYYLEKGYHVLAVEANPELANHCKEKFKDAIKANRLTILNAGVAKEAGVLPFYVNLYTSEWSSFDKTIGSRNNTSFETINVPCVTTKSLFEEYGVPYYMKVDIEGNDFLCLNDIPDSGIKPPYVSCEAVHLEWLDILKQKGYTKFKLINQGDGFNPINLSREKKWYYPAYRRIRNGVEQRARKIIQFRHLASSSGPFGEDTKGKWKTYEETRQSYLDFFQGDLNKPVNYVSWWDFHAAL
ncbi:MAG TPA: FkbM family methyltransferase [Chitinophagaceae bacterium]